MYSHFPQTEKPGHQNVQQHNLKPSINVSCIYYELVNVRMLTCLNYIVNMAHMSFVMPRFHSPFTDKTTWVDF